MKKYHAHIYFNSHLSPIVQEIRFRALELESNIFVFHKIYNEQVGPHHLPMIELHFDESHKDEVIDWIDSHRKDLSVLIHEDSGDDIKDHLSPIWLGEKLPIDFTFFNKVKENPALSIH